jgi:excisionase family DNA binding protein
MLLTVEEVARDHLKVSRATVYRLIRAGELRSSKVLGCTRISVQELERFENMIGGVL